MAETTPLATVAGVLALVAGVGLAGVPLLSWSALLWFWTSFALVWLASFALHTFTGADGIALVHTLQMWRYLRTEQRARLDRINRMMEDDR
jgi:predicted ferric reductase